MRSWSSGSPAAAGEPCGHECTGAVGRLDRRQAGDEQDELLEQALRLLETKQTVSTSLLQRQLRIGYPRAARLMEQLEEMGAVGPDEGGGRSRGVLMRSEGQDIE